jgi:dTDP-4-dehydrorhamnose 3,5-epimerase
MKFTPTPLSGSYVILPTVFADDRGWFARTFCKNEFAEIGHNKEWVQLNHSFSKHQGTVRGMHFQFPPHSEIKMVRCISGKVFDVIVDLRADSPTYLNWFGTELSSENRAMMYIPQGFAHGFQTLAPDSELIYHHTSFYTPNAEGGLRFDDVRIGIEWPMPVSEISDRDKNHPLVDNQFSGIKL